MVNKKKAEPVELQKEVKEMETNTKFGDSGDEMDWSRYKNTQSYIILKSGCNYAVSDDKAMETKASNAIDFEQMEEATHLESETDTVMSEIPVEHVPCNSDVRHCDDSAHRHESESLKDVGVDQLVEPELGIDKNVGKIRFDLNLQPAADMQTMDDDDDGSVSNDCKNPFEPSESRAHDSKSCAAQPLVLV
ncbi:hypothetical protein L6452_10921 [Arctium lappa]|uniref:Uncharacterized protein n=1 Tax=Arctium lappa TaxID=4217 RepID=A0ACB9DND8_ARCLA|nr:hypothetical protein L6452_10921 [Arctium lappa]